MTYKNLLLLILDLESKNTPPVPNLSKIKPISCQICKFVHFSIPRHIHNRRLPWQHLRLMSNVPMCKMTPHRCKIKLVKFHFDILWCYGVIKESYPGGGIQPSPPGEIGLIWRSYGVTEFPLLRKVSQGGDSNPPPRRDRVHNYQTNSNFK